MNHFKVFVYRHSVFMDQGLSAIKPVLARPSPKNLFELKLVNCQTAPRIIEQLLQFMTAEKVPLRAFALVRMNLHTHGLQLVAKFLNESSFLEDLDLSWNNLIPSDFKLFLEVLSNNRTLRVLNLSCNMLVEKRDQNNKFDFDFQSA